MQTITYHVIGFRPDGSRFEAAEEHSYERASQIKTALLESDAFDSVTIEQAEIHQPSRSVPAPAVGTGTHRGRG